MPSAQEIAKRALVQLVRTQGSQYGVDVAVTRESPPGDVTRAFRALARKAHPDKPGGSKEDFQEPARLIHLITSQTVQSVR